MTDQPAYLEHAGVRIGTDGVAEMDRGRPLVRISRPEITSLELCYGTAAERPIVCLVLGLVLLSVTLVGPVMLLFAWMNHSVFYAKFITTAAFVVPAVWLLDLSVRRRWYVRVQTVRTSRKLPFRRPVNSGEVERFVFRAKAVYGYA